MWEPMQPVVVTRAWNRVDVKVELITANAARNAVVRGLVYCKVRRAVHIAVTGGRASMARPQGVGGTPEAPGMKCGGRIATMLGRPTVGATLQGRRRMEVGSCFRCGRVGH